MSLFDESSDSILEIPIFQRIKSKTTQPLIDKKDEEFVSIETKTTTDEKSNQSIETLTIDDDSNQSNPLHCSPNNDSNDSIEVMYCSPNTPNKDNNRLDECEDDWSDCKSSADNWSPIKPSFLRTPKQTTKVIKNKSSVKKYFQNKNKNKILSQNEKMVEKEERERVRNEKKLMNELNKNREKANKEVLKSRDIKESLKYCIAIIDQNLYEMVNKSVDELFAAKEAKYELTESPCFPSSVIWIKKQLNIMEETDSSGHSSQSCVVNRRVEQNYILVLIETEIFIERVHSFVIKNGETLFDFVKDIKHSSGKQNITILVHKLEQYFKRLKSKSDDKFRQRFNELYSSEGTSQPNRRRRKSSCLPTVTKEDVDLAIIDMEVRLMQWDSDCKVSVIKSSDNSDIATYILRYTRAVAESSARRERNGQQNFGWFADADNRNTVDPIDDQSYEKLWKKQLMQFPKISYEIANAIVIKYPTPKCLLEMYSRVTQPELLLSDIVVTRRQPNGNTTERKIGKEMSTRVHIFMTSKNAEQLLSN